MYIALYLMVEKETTVLLWYRTLKKWKYLINIINSYTLNNCNRYVINHCYLNITHLRKDARYCPCDWRTDNCVFFRVMFVFLYQQQVSSIRISREPNPGPLVIKINSVPLQHWYFKDDFRCIRMLSYFDFLPNVRTFTQIIERHSKKRSLTKWDLIKRSSLQILDFKLHYVTVNWVVNYLRRVKLSVTECTLYSTLPTWNTVIMMDFRTRHWHSLSTTSYTISLMSMFL